MLRNTRSAGGVPTPPTPNTAPVLREGGIDTLGGGRLFCFFCVVEQRRKSRRKPAGSILKLLRPLLFQVNIEVTRDHQNVKIVELDNCPEMCDRWDRPFNRVLDGSLQFTLRHFSANVYFVLRKNISKLFCDTTLFVSSSIYRFISKNNSQRFSVSSAVVLTVESETVTS